MRVLRGEPIENSAALLSSEQRHALDKAIQSNRHEAGRLREVRDVLKTDVRDALAAGVPARLLAAELGLTRGRVYQMRDEANERSRE